MLLFLLIQLSIFLAMGLVIAALLRRNPARSHVVLVVTALGTLVVPCQLFAFDVAGWGWLQSKPVSLAKQPIATPDDARLVDKHSSDSSNSTANYIEPDDAQELSATPQDQLLERWSFVRNDQASSPNNAKLPVAGTRVPDEQVEDPSRRSQAWNRFFAFAQDHWRSSLFGIWFVGTLLWITSCVIQARRSRVICKEAQPCRKAALLESLQLAQDSIALRRRVSLWTSHEITSPVISCWGECKVIIPHGSENKPIDWQAVLTHELSHAKRRDHVTTLLIEVASAVFFWHPLMFFLRRKSSHLSELACDRWALRFARSAEDFSESMLSFASGNRYRMLSQMSCSKKNLERRIRALLGANDAPPESGLSWNLSIVIGALLVLPSIGLFRHRAPTDEPIIVPAIVELEEVENNDSELEYAGEVREQEGQDQFEGWTDQQWEDHLTTTSPGSRWYIFGINAGREMSSWEGDRAFRLLKKCWSSIDEEASPQILKGFYIASNTEETRSDDLFQILHLGMISGRERDRQFATTYLSDLIATSFKGRQDEYLTWYDSIKHLKANAILDVEMERVMAEFRSSVEPNAIAMLEKLSSEELAMQLRDCKAFQLALQNSDVSEKLEAAFLAEELPLDRSEEVTVLRLLNVGSNSQWRDWVDERFRSSPEEAIESRAFSSAISLLYLRNDIESIPMLIAMFDSDNSQRSHRDFSFALSRLTGARSSLFRDGAWWRRWWEENKAAYADELTSLELPMYPPTKFGASYTPFPEELHTFEGKIKYYEKQIDAGQDTGAILSELATAHGNKPEYIPAMIGLIEADNSYDSVYFIGYFGLAKVTGVQYNSLHDGAWWRRWWEKNKTNFAAEIQAIEIPSFKKTPAGESYQGYAFDLNTVSGINAWFQSGYPAPENVRDEYIAELLHEVLGDVAIPLCIEWLGALEEAGVPDDLAGEGPDGVKRFLYSVINDSSIRRSETNYQWFKEYWKANQDRYSKAAQNASFPNLEEVVKRHLELTSSIKPEEDDDEFEGFPAEKFTVGDNAKKTYFLIGPAEKHKMPEQGWKLVLILPGGDGSADFHPFCRRIHQHALPNDFVAVQLVAPVWKEDENRTVWPTQHLSKDDGEFTTEQFIQDVVKDVSKKLKVDSKYVFALGWSSSGPAVYANSLSSESPVTGSYVAMSVFRKEWMGDLTKAKSHPYFILHSPDDWISYEDHAVVAEKSLKEQEAIVRLKSYRGGHGWRDDPYGNIRAGVEWLTKQVEEADQ